MTRRLTAISLAAILASTRASAQPHSVGVSRVPPADQDMTFSDELVRSQLVRPDLTGVRGNRATRAISLLRTRQHFVQEMLKSVENF